MLKHIVSTDIIKAMKSKDETAKGVLRILKGNIEKMEIEKQRQLTEMEEDSILQREVKQIKEAIADAEKYSRPDLVDAGKQKLEVIYKYLPEQLTAEQVKSECKKLGIEKGMNMGVAMKLAMPALSSKAESALISKTVKELIQ